MAPCADRLSKLWRPAPSPSRAETLRRLRSSRQLLCRRGEGIRQRGGNAGACSRGQL